VKPQDHTGRAEVNSSVWRSSMKTVEELSIVSVSRQ
jgi:hypothetical protein